MNMDCLLYTSDAADEEDSVDLGGRRIIKKIPNTDIVQGITSEANVLVKPNLASIKYKGRAMA